MFFFSGKRTNNKARVERVDVECHTWPIQLKTARAKNKLEFGHATSIKLEAIKMKRTFGQLL